MQQQYNNNYHINQITNQQTSTNTQETTQTEQTSDGTSDGNDQPNDELGDKKKTIQLHLKEEKTLHNRENKIKSLNQGALTELEGSLYLIRKGYTVVLTIEQKKSKSMLQRFRTHKIFDSKGTEIFNNTKIYEVITTEDGKKELKTNEKGYPIEKKQSLNNENVNKQQTNGRKERKCARNDIVILHIVYNIMLHNEINAEKNLIRIGTKLSSENKVSKFRLKKIPLVNDLGITEKFTGSNDYRETQSLLMHSIISDYFGYEQMRSKANNDQIRYVCIGDNYQYFYSSLCETNLKSCICISRQDFLTMMKEKELLNKLINEEMYDNPIGQQMIYQNQLPNDETVVTTSNQEVFNDQMNSCVLQNEIVNANSFGMFNEYEINMNMNTETRENINYNDISIQNIPNPIHQEVNEFNLDLTNNYQQEMYDEYQQQVYNEYPIQQNETINQPYLNEMNNNLNNNEINIIFNQNVEMNQEYQSQQQIHYCSGSFGIIVQNSQMHLPVLFPLNSNYYSVPIVYLDDGSIASGIPISYNVQQGVEVEQINPNNSP